MGMFDSVRAGLLNPKLIVMEAWKFYTHCIWNLPYSRVIDRDWDILIILDGCRFDLFEETHDLEGSLQPAISPASCTREWLKESFPNEYPDTVYVSANPQTQIHGVEDRFFKSVRVWDECWSEEVNTALPEGVASKASDIGAEYPNKRLIVHFVQPHYPFIGTLGQRIEHRGFHKKAREGEAVEENVGLTVWDRLKNGQLTRETVWQAYRENLEQTLPYISDLVNELEGKPVISSDHGNALGEWNIYGHPCGLYHPSLVKVPWFEIDFDERREIIAETVTPTEEIKKDSVRKRLEDLGYVG